MQKPHLISGDLWEHHRNGAIVAVTTGGLLLKDGRCSMPSGCARQAADRFPSLPYTLGDQIRNFGMHVFDLGQHIVSFPVENSPFENPELRIIDQSCRELVELANYKQWQEIIVPRPGCGRGGLDWQEVEPVLRHYFDDRFYIITHGEN
ncbi:ADP-ribose-binding protein [uncultured Desulfuromusa sp.]|uniref:ADP-ribose-binding protein n=1 Tax=uncultured Desulfuromusa sp. TaxID=219183 RepID=UPI002AA6A527|nr:ADP-ribose-binding protein [uncultured Desulfuromusa sp.]